MDSNYKPSVKEPRLGPLILVSAIFHAVLLSVFTLMPTLGKASSVVERPKAIMFNIDVDIPDKVMEGLDGVPKKGPAHDGKISIPPPPSKPETSRSEKSKRHKELEKIHKYPDPKAKKKKGISEKPEEKSSKKKSGRTSDAPDALRKEIDNLNKGRTGEYTRPDGDPNSAHPGPRGSPGGNPCSVYRHRVTRYIRRAGSVPEAAGRTVRIQVHIGPSGAVTSKHITKSSGVPIADKVALGLVPGRFATPPPGCGGLTVNVTVRFEGKRKEGGGSRSKMPKRQEKKKSHVPSAIDKALRELQ